MSEGQRGGGGRVRPLRPSDPVSLGRWRVIGRIGAGGMGVVYLGVDDNGNQVALKRLLDAYADDPDFRLRFSREVDAMRRISAHFVAPVVDADISGDVPWLASQYVPGPSLEEHVRVGGPLTPQDWHLITTGLAAALAEVHAAGVIHRDVKPANVILSPAGPHLIDFGIAHLSDATAVTRTGAVVGSPAWLAPEQLDTGEVSDASDLYSLGATMAFAATGRGPFGSGSTHLIIRRVLEEQPDLGGVTQEQRAVLTALMQRDPRRRPTAHELLALLTGGGAADPSALTLAMSAGATVTEDPRWPRPGSAPPEFEASLATTETATRISSGRRSRGRVVAASLVVLALVLGGGAAAYAFVATASAPGSGQSSSAALSSSASSVASPPRVTASASPTKSVRPSRKPTPSPTPVRYSLDYAGPLDIRMTCPDGVQPYVEDKTVLDVDGDGHKDVVFGASCAYLDGYGPLQMEAFLASPNGGSWDGIVLAQSEGLYFDQPCHPEGDVFTCVLSDGYLDLILGTFQRVNGTWRATYEVISSPNLDENIYPPDSPADEPLAPAVPSRTSTPKPPDDGISGSIG